MTGRARIPVSARGRQAEARRNDLAVLEAARDVFATQGADAPIAAVAARAGVGVGSLYRRYGSKTELLQRLCLLAMEQALQAGEQAMATADPWTGLTGYIHACIQLRSGALASLAVQIPTTTQMQRAARRGLKLVDDIVERAHRDGSLRADATAMDITWLIEQFGRYAPGPNAVDEEADAERANVRARLLTIALDGLCAPSRTDLPGRAPSRTRYVNRWTRESLDPS